MRIINKYLLYLHNQKITTSDKGGLNTTMLQVFSMCKALSCNGVKVRLFIEGDDSFDKNLDAFEKGAFTSELPFEVSHWSRMNSNQLFNKILIRKKILRLIKLEQPDIIMTREPFFLKPISKTGIPVIYESHNSRQHVSLNILHKYILKEIIKAARRKNFLILFCISKALSEYWIKQNVEISKVFVWHDGFDVQLFTNQKEKARARELLSLPKDKKIATYTGGLYPDREIESIIKLAQINPDVHFLIIGGPVANKRYFESLAIDSQITNICFKGFVDHNTVPEYLFASDVLLALWSEKVPTIKYCSPLKLFEYMASGRIILAHNFPTIREVLIDGKDAVFCKPSDFEDLNNQFQRALAFSGEETVGIAAREKAFALYTWDNRAREMINYLDK